MIAPPPRCVAMVCDYSLDVLGGGETAFCEQVRALATRARVLAVSSAGGQLDRLAALPGVDAVAVRARVHLPVYGFPIVPCTPGLERRLVDAFRSHGVQVVHLHSEFGLAAAALSAARRLGLPVVHTVHTFFWQTVWPVQRALGWGVPVFHRMVTGLPQTRQVLAQRPGDSALRNMTLTVAQRVDLVVSPSAHQSVELSAAGLPRITVIPNVARAPAETELLTAVDGPLRILWAGRLVAEKRVLEFLRSVLAALHELPPDALTVRVLGDGELLSAARRLVDGNPAIELAGRVRAEDVGGHLRWSHVTALTSVGWDNQPMVVAESVSALRGVIVSDPALREGLAGPGIPAFGTDEEVLTRVLVALARDPEPVVAASVACLAARRTFSASTWLDAIETVYRDAAEQPALSRRSAGQTPDARRTW